MTEIEKKAEEMRNSIEAAQLEAKAAKAEVETLKAELEEKKAELEEAKTSINNLDESVKAQERDINELKNAIKEQKKMDIRAEIKSVLDTKKSEIENLMKKAEGRFTVELKLATSNYQPMAGSQAFGNQVDSVIYAVPALGNTFLLAFGTQAITNSRLVWREATTNKNVGYVKELAANANKTEATFVEQYRQLAKVATYTEISSEADAWYEDLVNFVVNEAQALILADVDEKVWTGIGDAETHANEIWGIKAAATEFAGLATYEKANIADVIHDGIAQVKKGGYVANVVILSFKAEAELKGIKDVNGNYVYNQTTGMLGQVRVMTSAKVADAEMLIADNSCAKIYLGATLEVEFSRKAENDAWRVDVRKLAQVKVPTPCKKGLIKVANYTTAIADITKA